VSRQHAIDRQLPTVMQIQISSIETLLRRVNFCRFRPRAGACGALNALFFRQFRPRREIRASHACKTVVIAIR
jgi:hypothetical protein